MSQNLRAFFCRCRNTKMSLHKLRAFFANVATQRISLQKLRAVFANVAMQRMPFHNIPTSTIPQLYIHHNITIFLYIILKCLISNVISSPSAFICVSHWLNSTFNFFISLTTNLFLVGQRSLNFYVENIESKKITHLLVMSGCHTLHRYHLLSQ